jgi:hypothetical protein
MRVFDVDLKVEYYVRRIGGTKLRGPVPLSNVLESIGDESNYGLYEVALAQGHDAKSLQKPESWQALNTLLKLPFSKETPVRKSKNSKIELEFPASDLWSALGAFLLALGVLIFLYFTFLFERSVVGGPRDIINLAREHDRLVGVYSAVAIGLTGILIICTARISFFIEIATMKLSALDKDSID